MARRRSNTPRSNTGFVFPIQLPVLHPPRLKRKVNNPSSNTLPPAEPTVGCMPPVRNHKRSNTLELPDIENEDDTVPQIRYKRKHMTSAALPLSPRALNVELERGGKPGKPLYRVGSDKKLEDGKDRTAEFNSNLCFSRTAALELSFEEPAISYAPQEYKDSYFPESPEFYAEQLEELVVRAAHGPGHNIASQAIHNRMLAELSAAATCSPVAHPSPFNVFPATPVVPSSCDEPPSPSESFGAPLSRMSSPSPYATYGESIDLAAMQSAEHRQQILSDLGSYDSRPLVERIIESMDEFEYDEICVDGLNEAECRQLRAESRKRRRLGRQRTFELGVLLELKHRQLGRSRSSSSSSMSSDSSDSCSDSSEPSTPTASPLAVRSVDQLVAKMLMKRREAGLRPCTSAVAVRAAFQARGCSSLRRVVEVSTPQRRGRSRSESAKATFSDLLSFSGGVFGLGSTTWLKEKKRYAALDIE
ncbi:hypothetical protein RHS01_09336 [Rhizoctonia solani]|uniref:Uncharacterized protein n=1 Tax=Rhizoctonia solani TaxID=456999 RepID=A0A8H7I3N6_9AGAM|nr:hypothetical protein RHS01_09336 [Rhizoctonia solani]